MQRPQDHKNLLKENVPLDESESNNFLKNFVPRKIRIKRPTNDQSNSPPRRGKRISEKSFICSTGIFNFG